MQQEHISLYLDHERRLYKAECEVAKIEPLAKRVQKLERLRDYARPLVILFLLGFANLQPATILKIVALVLPAS